MTARSTVAARRAVALLDFAVTKGASRTALLRRAGIEPAQLRDGDQRLPFERYVSLLRAAQQACGDPAFALHFGEAVDLEDISIIGMISGGESLADGGFDQMNRYTPLDFDVMPPGAQRFQVVRNGRELWLVDSRPDPNDFPELTECTFALMACTIRRYFGDAPFITAIHVTHAAPPHRAEYDRVLRVPVKFNSDKNALLLAESAWSAVAPTQRRISDYAARVMTAHADAMLEELAKSDTVRERVEAALIPRLPEGDCGAESIAKELGLSRQTLFRKLKAEGITFERVLDGLRHKLALRYLAEKKVTVSEAAYRLGFSDPAAFSRAFKRWTGTSPRSMRS